MSDPMDYTELLPPLPESAHLYHDAVAGLSELLYTPAQVRAAQLAAIAAAAPAIRRAERERCAKVCDVTPPYPFRPSIEAAHLIRALPDEAHNARLTAPDTAHRSDDE